MSYPNNQQGMSQQLQNLNLTPQQYATLINLLAQQPQASPTSSQFDPNYFSKLLGLQNQQTINSAQLSQQQSAPNQSTLNYQVVRVIDNPADIGPQEVSMGMLNVFPSSDKQRLYVKTWNNDGLIDTDTYILQNKEGVAQPSSEDIYTTLSQRIDDLEASLKKLQKQSTLSRAKSSSSQKPTKSKNTGTKESKVDDVTDKEDSANG